MRKNLLANVLDTPSEPRTDYARRGASRSMRMSIDEMAENAKRMIDGEVIVSLDPSLIDASFVSDRLTDDEVEFAQLKAAIEAHGQATPILVRPIENGRYMVVFGHRRLRAARELGRPVKAVVRQLEEIAHILAQGQENTARANLSFIEKALFAQKLLAMGQSKATIKSALTLDDTLLSRMLSVVETIPPPVLEAIGAARTVGRDRWEELKKLLAHPAKAALAAEVIQSDVFLSKEGAERFTHLCAQVKSGRRAARKPAEPERWSGEGIQARFRKSGKTFSLSLSSADAGEFGAYLAAQLGQLYDAFKKEKAR
ncbi:plasmid partitioning protein RepB [Methylobacterium nodulans]|uniref:Plasmid partitioning protein RepB n=1 Tax=Methylobacterium nodulans (strain LMG 21967 / CNCM I-2342 / ORS 2060) TaxID=460265 RepID=B8IWH4_METNO|nr:plasmid partitioning protein RepB [Methylobacterium nodulans]ACL62764.1 plasmid partitioning protein RepB [Methylobacterium nodulans ORS 2060]